MTGAEFMEVYEDRELQDYIRRVVHRRTPKPELREELMQEVWLVISLAPGDYSTEAYKRLVRPAAYSAWWQEYKEWQMMRHFGTFSAEVRMAHEYSRSTEVRELRDAGITIRTRKQWKKAKRRGK